MKKRELKFLIKECVREVLFEENVLSSVIAEVAYGIAQAQSMIIEQSQKPTQTTIQEQIPPSNSGLKAEKLQETRRKMLDAIGKDSMIGVFEGTEPLSSKGTSSPSPSAPSGPLSHMAPNDPGVNIDSLFRSVGNSWQKLKG